MQAAWIWSLFGEDPACPVAWPKKKKEREREEKNGNNQYECSYCHFVNCFGFVFEGLFSSLLLLFSSLVIWCLSFVMCLDCFFFFVCVSIVDFWFVVPMRFWFSSLYMYKIVLSCWSVDFKCISNILHLYFPLLMNFFWHHTFVWMISYLYSMFAFTGEHPHS